MSAPVLSDLKIKKRSRVFSLSYENGEQFELSFEFLRVHSPSAEVRGHGKGQEVLQVEKADVLVTGIEPTGNYAVRIIFDDGHDSGFYSWDYLYELAQGYDAMWARYLEKLEAAGERRSAKPVVVLSQEQEPASAAVQTFTPVKK